MAFRAKALFGSLALAPAYLLATAAPAADTSFTVPIVLSSGGLAGSFYTSELSLTNRGTTAATVRFTYTAAFGGGGGSGTDTLDAGRQKTVSDAIQYLISLGTPIPASGNRGGVLRVDFTGLSSADAAAATVRTTTALPGGRAGLAYAAFGDGIGGASFLCGLRQDASDRSNVALLNAGGPGAGDVVLRLTAFSGDPAAPVTRVLTDVTLAPGAFTQFTEVLKGPGLSRGWIRIDRVSGLAPYYAYATILDQVTSDGSFVPPLAEDAAYSSAGLTLPVVVETSAFETEVVLCNVSATAQTVRLSYVADAVQAANATAAVSINLAAGEQKVIPGFVQYLRSQGVAGVGARGPAFAGALTLTSSEATGGVFLGGRTQTAGGGGRFGLFYTAAPNGTSATSAAWLYGLQQNAENRTNLALVNTGETDASTVGLHVDLYDGATGAIAKGFDVALAPGKWTQFNAVLSDAGIANGYARIARTSGTNPFLAYAVVVDGGQPQSRTDDGAFVAFQVEEPPASPQLLAIRKVETKSADLRAQGLRRLDYVRAVADYMATLPEYTAWGVDEGSITAYGVFANGRLHMVTDNRVFDAAPAPLARAGRQALVTELPGSGWARLMQSFGETSFTQEPVYDLAAPLENPGGYSIRPGKSGDMRLSALRTISGDGFLYMNTHGGRAWKTKDQSGRGYYSLWSSTPVNAQTELQPEIAADLAEGLLTYFQASTFAERFNPVTGKNEEVIETHYGITGDFVKKYWHLASDSIVFLNACYSAYTINPQGPQDFIDACLAAGAGVYFGWNEKANSGTCYTTVRYFVDRLIGANKFMKENPDQRAFPWELVYDDMKSKGLTHDAVTGADLTAFPRAGGNSVILDPSIKEVLVNEYDETLHLKGDFGSRSGKVTVGGGELVVKTWAADEIVCNLPRTGPGANGDVVVEVPAEQGRTRKSNVHQLTEWSIPLHYRWVDAYGPGLNFDGTGRLRFRADVGSYREKPAAAPVFPLRGMIPTKDSQLPLTGSGSHTDGGCTTTLSGSGTFVSQTLGSVVSLILVSPAKVDANVPHPGGLGLAFGAAAGALPFRLTLSGNCSGSNPVAPTFGLLDGALDFPPSVDGAGPTLPLPGISLTFDGQFRIPAKRYVDTRAGGQLIVEWSQDVAPTPPVTFDNAR
jgi:hypothetical protein